MLTKMNLVSPVFNLITPYCQYCQEAYMMNCFKSICDQWPKPWPSLTDHMFVKILQHIYSHFDTPANGQAVIFLIGLLEVLISESSTLSITKPSQDTYGLARSHWHPDYCHYYGSLSPPATTCQVFWQAARSQSCCRTSFSEKKMTSKGTTIVFDITCL